jgi:23S rRNA-/tRNA-specific pseudouridylate synthase
MRSGIVHRLDKDTSRLDLVAKTEAARETFNDLQRRNVAKVYRTRRGHLAPPQAD